MTDYNIDEFDEFDKQDFDFENWIFDQMSKEVPKTDNSKRPLIFHIKKESKNKKNEYNQLLPDTQLFANLTYEQMMSN
jgi:hypothetical protein